MKTIELQCYGKSQRTGKIQLISQTFAFKEVKTMTKKEQLKVTFKVLLTDMLHKIGINLTDEEDATTIDNTADLMVTEVSIRTPLR